ncbi:MAG TPA: amino acid adenylation domain-containing protein, partial [Thermoanaerobaculia bacterium]|nr:amino acid adenylation domain-containing protein [Thermoanaerobaculia bacterium]
PLPEPPLQYVDFALWQRRWLAGEALEHQLAFWKQALEGAPTVLALPADRPRPPVQRFRGRSQFSIVPVRLAGDLKLLGRRQGATPFMALLASLGALLGRLTAQDDLLVGAPIAGRPVPATEGLIGLFLNLLALRVDLRGGLAGGPGFGTLLGRVREVTFAAFAHQDLPFEKLIEELALARDLSHSPLFQVMLVLHNEPQAALELPDLRLEFPESEGVGAKLDLVLNCEETADGLGIRWIYNSDLFDASRIARLAGHLETLLAAAVADPERPVGELALLAPHEVRQLLEWNDSARAVPLEDGFLGHFGRQVAQIPQAVAAVCEGDELTYAELDRRSDLLGWHLLRFLPASDDRETPGEPVVAVLAERGFDWLTAVLALFKAGLVYLPLDPRHPAHRHAQVLRESRARLVLAAADLAPVAAEAIGSLPLDQQPVLLGFSDLAAPVSPSSPSALPGAELHQLAYVIFTSGSTGVPKGAMVVHLGMLNHLFAKIADLGLGATDTVAQTASQCFDISVWQLLAALVVGGRVEIFPDEVAQNPGLLLEQVRARDVTILETVPSLLRAMVEEAAHSASVGIGSAAQNAARQEQALRWMMPTGEALPPDLCDRWLELFPHIPLINAYGPTECSDDVTHCVLREPLARGAVTVPIGRPVLNLQLYVGSRGLDLQPLGVPGELCVGGIAVGRGYLNDPVRTAAVFVPDPFSVEPGGRLYRTGDLARWLASGEIEFLGRVDHQVKVRGFRIELGEIETALASHPSVRETVVVARQQATGEQRLIAYLAPADETALEPVELAVFLRERIPEYMVPATFVVLPFLPLTANGKVDRKALPAPDEQAESRAWVAPRNVLEEYLAGHFSSLLKRDRVSVHDDFFDLGGSSISGAVLINRLQRELGEIVHVVVIFDAPTVERLAAYLVREHPQAVARRWGGEVLDGREAAAVPESRVDAGKLAEMRRLIRPAAPAVVAARNPGAVFILSPPRSGSTLLRVMLGGNPRLFAPPELELLPFDTLAEREAAFPARDAFWLEGALRAVMEARGWNVDPARAFLDTCTRDGWSTQRLYGEIQGWIGGRMLVDKTTTYALDVGVLRRAEQMFEEPRYLHLLRHPGAMIRSFEEAKLDQTFFRAPHRFARRELAELIWLVCEQNIGHFLGEVDDRRHHQVRFEDLVRDPVPVLRGICHFLEIDYHPAMAEPYQETRARMTDGLHEESRMLGDVKFHQHRGVEAGVAEQWREHLSEDDLGAVTWSTAAALGYERRVPPGWREFSSLVRLREGAEAPPLFLVHPVGGNVLCYAQLAQRLGAAAPSGAIYGLQSAGLALRAVPHEAIEAMAAHYLEAIREVRPGGPYRFAGWSVGGLVAFEMARQVEQAGERVELLALLDSVAPGVLPEGDPDPAELLFNLIRDLAGLAGREEELEREIIERLDPEADVADVLRRAQEIGALPPDFDPAQAEQLWRVFRANATAARRYTPGPYGGRVSLVTSARNPFRDTAGSHLGWDRWAGDLEAEVLDADHYDLLREPAVLGLAAWLRARLSSPSLSPDRSHEVHLLSPGA